MRAAYGPLKASCAYCVIGRDMAASPYCVQLLYSTLFLSPFQDDSEDTLINALKPVIEEMRGAKASGVEPRMPRCPQRCRKARYRRGIRKVKRRHMPAQRRVPTRLSAFQGHRQ